MPERTSRVAWSRRNCMQLLACGTSAVALTKAAAAAPAAGQVKRISFAQCQRLTPLEMAKSSSLAVANYQYLIDQAKQVGDAKLRRLIGDMLANPAPSILELYPTDAEKEKTRQQLIGANLLNPEITAAQIFPPAVSPKQAPQPFLGTPGSGFGSHHSYPGGLGLHVALNVRTSLSMLDAYASTNGFRLNHDIVLAAQLLHDIQKPWIFQWKADGSPLTEYKIGGTGVHHIMAIADCIHRGLSPELVVALASAHDNPGAEEDKIVAYIKSGAIIAGKDPVAYGLLAPSGKNIVTPRRMEGFVVFLGDHEWVVSVPAEKWALAELQDIAAQDYGLGAADMNSPKFHALRNYVFAHTSITGLHEQFVAGGRERVRATVNALIAKS